MGRQIQVKGAKTMKKVIEVVQFLFFGIKMNLRWSIRFWKNYFKASWKK